MLLNTGVFNKTSFNAAQESNASPIFDKPYVFFTFVNQNEQVSLTLNNKHQANVFFDRQINLNND